MREWSFSMSAGTGPFKRQCQFNASVGQVSPRKAWTVFSCKCGESLAGEGAARLDSEEPPRTVVQPVHCTKGLDEGPSSGQNPTHLSLTRAQP